jgi:hypothetical protein
MIYLRLQIPFVGAGTRYAIPEEATCLVLCNLQIILCHLKVPHARLGTLSDVEKIKRTDAPLHLPGSAMPGKLRGEAIRLSPLKKSRSCESGLVIVLSFAGDDCTLGCYTGGHMGVEMLEIVVMQITPGPSNSVGRALFSVSRLGFCHLDHYRKGRSDHLKGKNMRFETV